MDALNTLLAPFDEFTSNLYKHRETLESWWAAVIGCTLYLVSVVIGKGVMAKCKEFDLRVPMGYHNLLLFVWSVLMAVGGFIEVVRAFARSPALDVYCGVHSWTPSMWFWAWLFYISKYYEFFDTLFIVLRKRQLLFLHVYVRLMHQVFLFRHRFAPLALHNVFCATLPVVYPFNFVLFIHFYISYPPDFHIYENQKHHAIVVPLSLLYLKEGLSFFLNGVISNALIHTFMYWSYYKQSFGVSVSWKKHLTKMQMVQFVWGMFTFLPYPALCGYSYTAATGPSFVFWFHQLVLFSFLMLFMQFFQKRYNTAGQKGKTD